ncbi:HAD superfamily hydrolase [Lactobacillus selangorensis]|uniref:HAD superfamily hydrolase n=2 Tax=Lactobacillus selangorensis TaxID=81857 RepID=A0A0R2G8E2_9LACO|nr:HAD superfamily hydrolase [Lactobacillus selangorensis]KRN32877.1 HAD superfamily hydrolase [Lactobacillus selangorensis]
MGIKVVLCSGRPLAGVKPYLEAIGIQGDNQYAITYNGSVVSSVSGRTLVALGLSNKTYRAIDQYAQAHHLPYNVLDENSQIYTSNRDVNWVTVVQARENLAGIYVRTPDELPTDFTIVKAVFVGEAAALDQQEPGVKARFGNDFYVVRAAANFLEIMNPDANKGSGLKNLAENLGLAPENIMAFGDEQNDIPMFDYAGTAVAMGNGSEAAKAHADYITASNDDDGIAKALDQLVFAQH